MLVDSRPGIASCVDATLAYFGLAPVSREELDALIGPPLAEGFAQILATQGGDPRRAPEFVRHYRELYVAAAIPGTALQPGIREALVFLAAVADLAIATSKSLRFADPILDALGIREFFSVVVGPTPQTDGETKTQTLARALTQLGERRGSIVDVARTPMVGDRHYDVIAARALGLVAVGALWGYGSERELRAAGARVILREPRDLTQLIVQPHVVR